MPKIFQTTKFAEGAEFHKSEAESKGETLRVLLALCGKKTTESAEGTE